MIALVILRSGTCTGGLAPSASCPVFLRELFNRRARGLSGGAASGVFANLDKSGGGESPAPAASVGDDCGEVDVLMAGSPKSGLCGVGEESIDLIGLSGAVGDRTDSTAS